MNADRWLEALSPIWQETRDSQAERTLQNPASFPRLQELTLKWMGALASRNHYARLASWPVAQRVRLILKGISPEGLSILLGTPNRPSRLSYRNHLGTTSLEVEGTRGRLVFDVRTRRDKTEDQLWADGIRQLRETLKLEVQILGDAKLLPAVARARQ